MKKSLVTHILVMVIAAGAGSFLAGTLVNDQGKICISRSQFLSKKALGGFNKFAADVQWMLFINYCGSLDSVTEKNAGEVIKRLENILGNDPDFENAYEMGALMISVCCPEKALQILKRGCDNPRLKKNWKLPFFAGFILNHHVEKSRLEKVIENISGSNAKVRWDSEAFFALAAKRGSPYPEPHVISALMRARGAKIFNAKTWKNINVVNEKQALLCAWIDEWSNNNRRAREREEMATSSSSTAFSIKDINSRLIQVALFAKQSAPDNPSVLSTIDYMRTRILKGQHLCERCLYIYAPGDKFCANCGEQTDVFGTCLTCGAVLKGKYCSACGSMEK